ncbi:MAG: DUF177 domain-containing protein [Actinomycetaceae bacterium]|nr:DUF177 domain-containing protein [Actinomycetaceae bacterium]
MTSPLSLSLASLKRQEGERITWENTCESPGIIGHDVLHVPDKAPLDISLSLSSVSEGVYVQGTVRAPLIGQCSRCLKPLEEEHTYDIAELVFYPERHAALIEEGDEDAEDAPVICDDHIDLEPLIRDAISLALPFQPLCREDCAGLCPECGEPLEELPDDHAHEAPYNPQFDALAGLEAQLREAQ